ncbi:MAG TPA: DNA ligase D [Xanthobacteraceae bacterium]
MGLERYHAKRRFDVTAEPRGKVAREQGRTFVIQKHAASRLHYDLRLELDGVMKSWAITRGPSLVPGEKRLAVHVEDHPIEYNTFEGTIPQGQYGGGTVMIWDRGQWFPEGDPHKGYKKGQLDFRLEGEKLHGRWHLVRMRKRAGERQDPWLLIKSADDAARTPEQPDILEELPLSAASGRDMDQIAAGDAVWHSNRPPKASKAKSLADTAPRIVANSKTAKAAPRKSAPKPEKKPRAAAKRTRAAAKKSGTESSSGPGEKEGALRAPLPEFVEPCLALLTAKAPEGANWLHEVKFDGYRIQARLDKGGVQLRTRRGLDWTDKFSPIAEAIAGLPAKQALLDGEIVVEVGHGVSSFSALQEALKAGADTFVFYAFDLLYQDGYDLRGVPLIERKELLQTLLQRLPEDGPLRFSGHFEIDGAVLLKHACDMKLEGIISKLRDAPYRSGRNGDWLKTKCSDRQEFVITGYSPATNDPSAIGALMLGYYEDGGLRYAGRVGTGFTHKTARELARKLDPLRTAKAPFNLPAAERGRNPVWVKPALVAEVDSRGWTHGDRLRQASFKGLREDKLASEVVREKAAMAPAASPNPAASPKASRSKTPARTALSKAPPAEPKAAVAQAGLTNPGRVYWDDVGLTKQGLAEYYTQVWDWIAPHVTGRALSLVRCPEGTVGQCFFQKHASAGLSAKRLRLVPEDGDHVIAIDDLDGLLALVQAGVLEIHVRGSRIERLDAADRIVFDLDPAPDVGWPRVVAAARDVRERLRALGLESFVKTTGGKGLHVVLPVEFTEWERVKAFAKAVAFEMAADDPAGYIATASKSARAGKIFVDYLRNSREATAICAYSTRARPGATVSVPIAWEELKTLKVPNRYMVGNVMTRLNKLKADPWADIGKVKQRLPQLRGRK